MCMRQMKHRESRVIALKWLISECCQTFIVTGNISFITSAPTTITNKLYECAEYDIISQDLVNFE